MSSLQNIDARGSTFNQVGGDHIIVVSNNIYISASYPESTQHNVNENLAMLFGAETLALRQGPRPVHTHSISPVDSRLTVTHPLHDSSDHLPLSSGRREASRYNVQISCAGEIAALLIVKIVGSLMDMDSSDNYLKLKKELELLKQILILAGLAIQAYGHTPLGRNLTTIINREVEGCNAVLQELLGTIERYRQGLSSTSIGNIWRQVWLGGGEVDTLTPLRMKLSAHQKSLGQCLMTFKL